MYKYIFQIYITTIQYAFRVFFDMRYLFLLARLGCLDMLEYEILLICCIRDFNTPSYLIVVYYNSYTYGFMVL